MTRRVILRSLRARNLGPFRELVTPDFSDAGNVIVGPNGAGKSMLRNALSLALTGTCAGFESGQNLAALRSRDGRPDQPWQLRLQAIADGAEVTIDRTDAEGPRSNKQALVEAELRIRGPIARASLYGSELLRLAPKERQRLILDLAPKAEIEIPAEIRKAVKDLLGEDHGKLDTAGLDVVHKRAFEKRTDLGRTIKAIGEVPEPVAPDGLESASVLSVADLDVMRTEISERLEELTAERDEAVTAAAPKVRGLELERKAVERAVTKGQSVRGQLDAFQPADEMRAAIDKLGADLSAAEAENEDNRDRRSKFSSQLATAEADVAKTKQVLTLVASQPDGAGSCVLCNQKLTATARKTLKENQTKHLEKSQELSDVLRAKLHEIRDNLKTAEIEAERARLTKQYQEHARLTASLIEARKDWEDACAALAKAEAEAGQPGDPEAAKRAGELSARISTGNARLLALSQYLGERIQSETRRKAKSAAEQEYQALTSLLEHLGPTGLRKAVNRGGLAKFHTDVNALLEPLGFKADLRPVLDVQGDPLVTLKGRTLEASLLSRSERIRFETAFAIAAAQYSGLGVVVVDDFEALEPKTHHQVMEMLASCGCQWFVLAVQTDDSYEEKAATWNGPAAGITEARFFHLVDGELRLPTPARAGEAA